MEMILKLCESKGCTCLYIQVHRTYYSIELNRAGFVISNPRTHNSLQRSETMEYPPNFKLKVKSEK